MPDTIELMEKLDRIQYFLDVAFWGQIAFSLPLLIYCVFVCQAIYGRSIGSIYAWVVLSCFVSLVSGIYGTAITSNPIPLIASLVAILMIRKVE